MTRKRFIKLMMADGYSRNKAVEMAKEVAAPEVKRAERTEAINEAKLGEKYSHIVEQYQKDPSSIYPYMFGVVQAILEDENCSSADKMKRIREVVQLSELLTA